MDLNVIINSFGKTLFLYSIGRLVYASAKFNLIRQVTAMRRHGIKVIENLCVVSHPFVFLEPAFNDKNITEFIFYNTATFMCHLRAYISKRFFLQNYLPKHLNCQRMFGCEAESAQNESQNPINACNTAGLRLCSFVLVFKT